MAHGHMLSSSFGDITDLFNDLGGKIASIRRAAAPVMTGALEREIEAMEAAINSGRMRFEPDNR